MDRYYCPICGAQLEAEEIEDKNKGKSLWIYRCRNCKTAWIMALDYYGEILGLMRVFV